jgi:hypothetical protein
MQHGNFQENNSFLCAAIKQYTVPFMVVLLIADFSSRKRGTIIKHITAIVFMP